MRYLIGLDLGTTAIKAAIFDESLRKIHSATREYTLISNAEFEVEQDVNVYWSAIVDALNEVAATVNRQDILSLSVSAQGETMVFLDGENRPVYNAIVWMDSRAKEETQILDRRFSHTALAQITGQAEVIPLSPACKIMWFERNHPELFQCVRKILLLEDWFFFQLTGAYWGEPSLWCSTHMLDIHTMKYNREMLAALNVTEEMLPKIVPSGTMLPPILPDVARVLGLPENIALVMGGLDQAMGAIGVGNVEPGMLSESTGAAMVIVSMTEKPVSDFSSGLSCFCSAIPDMYMIHAFSSGGIAYKWLRDALCERVGGYKEMDRLAAAVEPGSSGLVVLPHFNGSGPPDSDPHARCVIYGLGLQHSLPHIIRAYLEGVAMSLCRMIEAIEEMGVSVKEVLSLSGGAESPLWCQIKADALNRPVVTMKNTDDAACLGAAVLAGVGAGLWPSVQKIARENAEVKQRYLPDATRHKAYAELLRKYKTLTNVLRDINPIL